MNTARNNIDGRAVMFRNKLNGEIFESRSNIPTKFIDGVEFIQVLGKHGRLNLMRKDTLEKVPNR